MSAFLHQYFYLLDKHARKKLIRLLFLFILSSILDVIGIGLIGVFLALMSNPDYLTQYFQSNAIQHNIDLSGNPHQTMIYAGVLIIAAFLFKAMMSCLIQSRITTFSFGYALSLKLKLMRALQYAPYAYHLQKNSAYAMDNLIQIDIYAASILMNSLMFSANLVIAFAIVGLLLTTHPITTMALVSLIGLIFFLNNYILKNRINLWGKIVTNARGDINKNFLHAFKGLKEIRILGQEDYFLHRTKTISHDYANALRNNALFQHLPRYIIEAVLSIFIILLCIGLDIVGMSPPEIVSFVAVFATAGARLLPTMNQLTAGINDLRYHSQTMTRLYEEFKILDDFNQNDTLNVSTHKMPFTTVLLKNINYQYPQGKQAVLHNVSFNFKKGQSIGLIGPSGAGKSTLVNLILGFLEPQKGQMLIDGNPLVNMREWLNNCAYIPQHIFLLDDSLKHNIALGVDDEHIDNNRMQQAIHMAQLETVVDELPDGLNTVIGENGIRLSGGQRQRVALARTFYHDRDIIIMDEATSSLDSETEYEIVNAIKRLHGIKTLIVIAHRLSTVEYCDVICKMEKGEIVEIGSFQDVISQKNHQHNLPRTLTDIAMEAR